MRPLTIKQRLFIKEYLIDLNSSAAVLRAGYKTKWPDKIGCQLLAHTRVKAELDKALDKRAKKIDINAEYVLKRLVSIDQMDVIDILEDNGELKPIKEWPKTWRTTLSGLDIATIMNGDTETVLKKIKWPDKVKNLELLGKHINVRAWDVKQDEKSTSVDDIVDAMETLAKKLPN